MMNDRRKKLRRRDKVVLFLMIVFAVLLFVCAKFRVTNKFIVVLLVGLVLAVLVVEVQDSLDSAWKLIGCLFMDTFIIALGIAAVLELFGHEKVAIFALAFLWPLVWIIISLVAETESSKLANNFYVTLATLVLSACSVGSMIFSEAASIEIVIGNAMRNSIAISILCMPFLAMGMLSCLLIQAKEYIKNKAPK